jgi:hypothetical protein
MRIEAIEIYSDQVNAAVMRHPNRKFPGVLIQGDSLFSFYSRIEDILDQGGLPEDAREELTGIRDQLAGYLNSYKAALKAHDVPLPFHEDT